MITIRLQRTGRENTPTYRIVVAEKALPVKGKVQEVLGHYEPAKSNPVLSFNQEAIERWIKKGATVSDTVARLLKREGMSGLDRFICRYSKRSKKNVEAPPTEQPAPAAA